MQSLASLTARAKANKTRNVLERWHDDYPWLLTGSHVVSPEGRVTGPHTPSGGQAVRTLQKSLSAGERVPKQSPLPFQPPVRQRSARSPVFGAGECVWFARATEAPQGWHPTNSCAGPSSGPLVSTRWTTRGAGASSLSRGSTAACGSLTSRAQAHSRTWTSLSWSTVPVPRAQGAQ